jgi:hypothetical protein
MRCCAADFGAEERRRFELPVNYILFEDDPVCLLITSTPERTWWRNLRGGAPLEICLRGRWKQGRALALEAPEQVASGLRSLFNRKPGNARYFNVRRDGPAGWNAADIERASRSRVIIQVFLLETFPG